MPKYIVKSPLARDKVYKIGDTIELSAEEAAELLGHTLALPGEDLDKKTLAAVGTSQEALEELRADREALEEAQRQFQEAVTQYHADRVQLLADQQQLTQDRDTLTAAQQKLVEERAELDKQIKAAAGKKSS